MQAIEQLHSVSNPKGLYGRKDTVYFLLFFELPAKTDCDEVNILDAQFERKVKTLYSKMHCLHSTFL